MVVLQINVQKRVILTLNELSNPREEKNYLILFQNEQSKTVNGFIRLTDLSLFPDSYNEFLITAKVDVDIEIAGDYYYKVYQMPTPLDVDYLNNGYLVEQGKMRLLKENESITKEYTSANEIKIFN